MDQYKIIVLGASAGGIEALKQLIARLPQDLPAALFVVVHFPSSSISVLPDILSRCKTLPSHHAHHNEVIQPGQIYVAPPDFHLLLHSGYLSLSRGPRENGHRPAVDTLFRSAAYAYRQRVIAVVLSGTLDDGTAGVAAVRAKGGMAIAQDPEEALFDGMPRSAIQQVGVDCVLKLPEIASRLVQLVNQPGESYNMPEEIEQESAIVAHDKALRERGERPGTPSMLTCPDCGGVLWELHGSHDQVIRFRCHVGHAYSMDSLIAEQADDIERALWSAVRALEEKAALARRMAVQAQQQNRSMSEQQFLERAEEAAQHAQLVRQIILQQIQPKIPDEAQEQ